MTSRPSLIIPAREAKNSAEQQVHARQPILALAGASAVAPSHASFEHLAQDQSLVLKMNNTAHGVIASGGTE
jgi:hypothetical protein